ncbi:LysR family transcriptional regulator [Parasphingopyxis marina]|uniref:LysR family transcriptional regulator n=1 Tax=Parasphingopyxis marina TaxID=2761622 RepID=A0A842HXC8_9SPHN|nr:LysR family transcriptional regulator [Parasphingopyxis marina]MBC2777077.1 LysR family transcriptional regulator [Parasphingopyxis marina]
MGFSYTLRQLEVFEVIRENRSFRVAAEQLDISQAAVSNHLKTLEEQLGISLFVREPGRRPNLTLQGMAFARDLQPFLAAAAVLNGHKRSPEDAEPAYRYKIYVGLSLLENYVRPKLDRFLQANPEIDLEFQAETPGPATLRKILENRFDFALLHIMPQQEIDAATRVLSYCRAGIFAHRSILPKAPGQLTIEDIGKLPFVLPRPGTEQENSMLEALSRVGIQPTKIAGRTQYYDVLSCMVEQGVGISVLCEAFISPEKRGEVENIWPYEPWRIAVRRSPGLREKTADAVETFLVDCIFEDGNYPALEPDAEPGVSRAETLATG